MLFLTHTSLSVPALMGAIMCMGVGTANSILLVSFAREYLRENNDVVEAALDGWLYSHSPGANDSTRDDYWHVADGAGLRGRR